MTQPNLKDVLLGRIEPELTIKCLNEDVFPQIQAFLNENQVRKLAAIYGGERVPENERNLTDVRNRMSLLLEHSLVDAFNNLISSCGIDGIWLGNVVANRFPDLEIRDSSGSVGLRLEIKCLQSIAEEKAANFSTLIKDLNPASDFVVVILWEWDSSKDLIGWDRAPLILKICGFHASSLAYLRDRRWLTSPPANLGDGYQGFDLLFAMTSRDGEYKEEEGNYGKLLRIWTDQSELPSGASKLLQATVSDYLAFEDLCISSGYLKLAELISAANGSKLILSDKSGQETGLLFDETRTGFVLSRRMAVDVAKQQAADLNLKEFVLFADRYSWKRFVFQNGVFNLETDGAKPKDLYLNRI